MRDEFFDDDNFDEEAEANERYPFLSADNPDESEGRSIKTPSEAADGSDTPNYHYLRRLTDEFLPGLNFYRFDNLFEARPARAFLEKDTPQKRERLFSDYWRSGEIAILFADTGTGKSILAVQIAQAIASGIQFGPFELDAPRQRVAYFDFELSQAQFESRYSLDDDRYPAQFPFHVNLIRCPPRPDGEVPPDYRDYTEWLTNSMVDFIEFSDARVVIIDNITWLNNSSQIGNSAARVMKALQLLKKRLGLSILVIAHTPKRPIHSALDINDLQGSIMLATFADSIFALGTSRQGPDIRYLKAVKFRSSAARASATEVAVLRLVKDQCFLGLEYVGTADESEHTAWLKGAADPARMKLIRQVAELAKKGWTQRRIGEAVGVSAATVNRCIKARKQ